MRLKARYDNKTPYAHLISIPFGAIKSLWIEKLDKKERISIPFGAIKRNLNADVKTHPTIFQFLLVRLKEEREKYKLKNRK